MRWRTLQRVSHSRPYLKKSTHSVTMSSEETECQVCFTPFTKWTVPMLCSAKFDNAVVCLNGHHLCTACAGKILEPAMAKRTGDSFSGFSCRCPLCRSTRALDVLELLVISRGSWASALETFPCACMFYKWLHNKSPPGGCCTEPEADDGREVDPREGAPASDGVSPPRRSSRLAERH